MSSNQILTPLRQRMLDDLRMRKLSDGTQRAISWPLNDRPHFLADRRIPPQPKTFGVSNYIWSTEVPRRSR